MIYITRLKTISICSNIHINNKMVEKNLIINNRELKYKGIFRIDELYQAINRALEAKGYAKNEKKSEELVTESGRKIFVELRPSKIKTAYMTLLIKIRINVDNLTETVEQKEGISKKFHQGDVVVSFDSWLMSDYENRWNMKPWAYFLKAFIGHYFFKFPLEEGFPGELAGDTAFIYGQIKKLLNSYNAADKKHTSTEDVMKDVAQEIENVEKEKLE